MSKTPIEFLVEQLQSAGFIPKDSIAINYIIEEAKKKETLEKQHTFTVSEILQLQSKIHVITGDGEVMQLFNSLLGINAGSGS